MVIIVVDSLVSRDLRFSRRRELEINLRKQLSRSTPSARIFKINKSTRVLPHRKIESLTHIPFLNVQYYKLFHIIELLKIITMHNVFGEYIFKKTQISIVKSLHKHTFINRCEDLVANKTLLK